MEIGPVALDRRDAHSENVRDFVAGLDLRQVDHRPDQQAGAYEQSQR